MFSRNSSAQAVLSAHTLINVDGLGTRLVLILILWILSVYSEDWLYSLSLLQCQLTFLKQYYKL